MKKISKVDAYAGMSTIDQMVMDQEVQAVFESEQRNGREMTDQFFLDSDGSIVLEMYWEGRTVQTMRFANTGELTEEGKKVVKKKEKDITHRIAYFTRKVAEKVSIHPAKKTTGCIQVQK